MHNIRAELHLKQLFLTVVNPHADSAVEARISLYDGSIKSASASVLTHSNIHAHNTFDALNVVEPVNISLDANGSVINHTFPPASVTAISAELV
jgi:alpha-N-arabinofuranosidase